MQIHSALFLRITGRSLHLSWFTSQLKQLGLNQYFFTDSILCETFDVKKNSVPRLCPLDHKGRVSLGALYR